MFAAAKIHGRKGLRLCSILFKFTCTEAPLSFITVFTFENSRSAHRNNLMVAEICPNTWTYAVTCPSNSNSLPSYSNICASSRRHSRSISRSDDGWNARNPHCCKRLFKETFAVASAEDDAAAAAIAARGICVWAHVSMGLPTNIETFGLFAIRTWMCNKTNQRLIVSFNSE